MDYNFVFGAVGAIGTVILVLDAMGLDLKIFGKGANLMAPTSGSQASYTVARWKLRAILGLSVFSLIFSGLGWYRSAHLVTIPSKQEWYAATNSLQIVRGKPFTNEEVELDGKAFENCTFTNVTFVWKGTKPFAVANNVILLAGPLRIVVPDGPLGESAYFIASMLNELCKGEEKTCPIRDLSVIFR